ncbi:MAG: C_GCAxxG_C_C family protein [Oscillospiraceae bacterium]|nr:C_GCAxxG_C_C family protein [Oscillospiraceae bacterium]
MSKYSEKAVQLFFDGNTCSQAVFAAFAPDLGLSEETALRISLGLGGGVGRMREICGTISAAAMLVGLRYPDISKADAYEKVRLISEEFRKTNPSIVCRELLGLTKAEESAVPEERTPEYYKKRPCIKIIGDSALAVEKILFGLEDE